MNALHKSLSLSKFAPVCVCPVIYSCAASLKGGGVRNATWNMSLRDNLAKQNNANKHEKEENKKGRTLKKCFSSNVQAIFLQALIISKHPGPQQHWNNGCRPASVAGLVELC